MVMIFVIELVIFKPSFTFLLEKETLTSSNALEPLMYSLDLELWEVVDLKGKKNIHYLKRWKSIWSFLTQEVQNISYFMNGGSTLSSFYAFSKHLEKIVSLVKLLNYNGDTFQNYKVSYSVIILFSRHSKVLLKNYL